MPCRSIPSNLNSSTPYSSMHIRTYILGTMYEIYDMLRRYEGSLNDGDGATTLNPLTRGDVYK